MDRQAAVLWANGKSLRFKLFQDDRDPLSLRPKLIHFADKRHTFINFPGSVFLSFLRFVLRDRRNSRN